LVEFKSIRVRGVYDEFTHHITWPIIVSIAIFLFSLILDSIDEIFICAFFLELGTLLRQRSPIENLSQ